MHARALVQQPLTGFVAVTTLLAIQTAILAPLLDEDALLPVALGYLLVALVAAAAWGWAVGLYAAVASNLLVNFFFVPPLHRLLVGGVADTVALALFLAVAATGAGMLSILRRQIAMANAARAESAALLSLSHEVASAISPRDSMNRLCEAATRAVHAQSCAIVQDRGRWQVVASSGGLAQLSREEESLAKQALAAGDTVTSPSDIHRTLTPGRPNERKVTFVPLPTAGGERGVLRLSGKIRPPQGVDQQRLLAAFANEASVVLHRARLQEEALRASSLQEADRLKTALLSSVSHDLRSPLMAISTAVESLADPNVAWSDDDREALVSTLKGQSDRLISTVNNLLEMSRVEGGVVVPHLEPIEAGELLEEVRVSTEEDPRGRRMELSSPEATWFRGDWGLVLQSMTNLVDNAAKYSTPGCPLRLGACREGSKVLLSVADAGPGIAETDLPHIFEKFYRGQSEADAKGSGLGLSIVKAMVELSGGHVSVASSPAGTSFTLAFPATATPR